MDASRDDPEAAVLGAPTGSTLGRVPVRGPGRGFRAGATLIGAVLVLAIVKPWDLGAAAPPAQAALHSLVPPLTMSPSATADGSPAGLAASICLGTNAWLLTTLETVRLLIHGEVVTQQVRVWRAMAPIATATGPDDPDIPIVVIAATQVDALGWCAPVAGGDGGPVAVTMWRIGPSADGAGAEVVPIRRIAPMSVDTPTAALYREVVDCLVGLGCSGIGVPFLAQAWAPGRYVLRWSDRGTASSLWFGADIESLPGPATTP